MYKWHVNSAIGRGRPVGSDFSRVADGIAGSIRQFSVSVSRLAVDGGGSQPPASRSTRSADVVRQVSSMLPPPRGIDARSLAAKPSSGFTITRELRNGPPPRQEMDSASGFRSRATFLPGGGERGPGGDRNRSAFGRGGARGRGARGRGGRGRGRGRKMEVRAPSDSDGDEFVMDPWSAAEKEELVSVVGGYTQPWKPATTLESLAGWMPPVGAGTKGLIDTAVYKMAVATDNVNPEYQNGMEHLKRVQSGVGTLFESHEVKMTMQEFRGPLKKALNRDVGCLPKEFRSFSHDDREALNKQWIAGQYSKPTPVEGDLLSQIAAYTLRNETYLPEDRRTLLKNLEAKLPVSKKPVEEKSA